MQKRQNKHPDPTPWLFLAPSLCGVTLFVLAPFVETVRRSVTDTMGRHFVGLANYTAVLGNDAFRLAVENTVRFIGVCVPLLLALSLALALALRAKGLKNTSWAEVCRTTFLLPMALPVASLALLWKVLFAQNGLVNGTFGTHCDFMGTDAAFWVLVGTYLWKTSAMTASFGPAGWTASPQTCTRPLPWMVPVGGGSLQPLPCPTCCPHWPSRWC